MNGEAPLLSVIVPVLNERARLDALIASLLQQDPTPKEVLLVDGGSNDGSVEHIRQCMELQPTLRLVLNPDRYVSQGFNRAYRVARGAYIALVGAHAVYPPGYFARCIEVIEADRCDAAAGFLVHVGAMPMGRAIAFAMSERFGVGDTAFRTDPRERLVDSAAFAVYSRRVFERCGLLDENLVRNQDDAFHYRLNAAGLRLLMLPDLKIQYHVRDSLSALWKQYVGYGLYKPLVFVQVGAGLRWRHLAPPAFAAYLLSLPAASWSLWWLLPLGVYAVLSLRYSLPLGWGFWRAMAAFLTLHAAYGWGFLRGLWRWRRPLLRLIQPTS